MVIQFAGTGSVFAAGGFEGFLLAAAAGELLAAGDAVAAGLLAVLVVAAAQPAIIRAAAPKVLKRSVRFMWFLLCWGSFSQIAIECRPWNCIKAARGDPILDCLKIKPNT
jgi:hypothetical protein